MSPEDVLRRIIAAADDPEVRRRAERLLAAELAAAANRSPGGVGDRVFIEVYRGGRDAKRPTD